jgi:hypothetical protein
MARLYLIAGHTQDKGEGAQNLRTRETENDIASKILLQVLPEIQKQVFTDLCPFDFSLQQKINWVNSKPDDDQIVVSCHLDSSASRKETGAMCYYYGGSEESKKKAQILLDKYCAKIGLKNNGVRPDTVSRFKRLGIIRDTKGWAFLLELGSINNDTDIVKKKGAKALLSALSELLGIEEIEEEKRIFTDVGKTHPYHEAIKWAKEKGIASGYDDGKLGADENLQVGRFLAFLQKYDNFKS